MGVIFENSDDLYDFGEVRVSGLRGDDAVRAVREEVPRVDGRAFDGGCLQSFEKAADLGDEHSRKILRLMSQCEK